MEEKSNQSTPLRPQGERILSSNLVEMDVKQFIQQIRSEKVWAESDHNSITIFKSEKMRIVLIGMHKGATLKTHTANAIISVQVVEGLIKFTADEQTIALENGRMIALQEKIPHSVSAVEDSFFLLTLAM
ncbi:MAG: cupin domain-containing protein [Bacteroidetes bacterium]|nr:cupin domain-containing protein [Bdellovibrionales bacterium]MCB0511578.1 cupin domain-containing protein [Bacteroidota bacterium]MCB0513087.1 cupin domain-containing protein [Bacteroidota bacterium]